MTYDYGRDHIQIMEILCAYVRENAPIRSGDTQQIVADIPALRSDIQTALTVIARRSAPQIAREASQRFRLDLRNCDLSRASALKGNFAGANFYGSNLDNADFRSSDLTGAWLTRCSINGTIFWDAHINGTHFENTNATAQIPLLFFAFTKTNFSSAFIEGADFSSARLPLDAFRKNSTFGTKDTKLPPNLEEMKGKMLKIADKLFMDEVPVEKTSVVPASEADDLRSSGFLYWSPLTADDLANGGFRDKFRKAHNLYGWPHTDT